MLTVRDPVSQVPGVSARAASALKNAFGITTVGELIAHYPRTYRDIGARVALSEAVFGEQVTLVGTVLSWSIARPQGRRRMTIARMRFADDDGGQLDVPFFNQEWQARNAPEGTRVSISGVFEQFRGKAQLKNAKLVKLAEGETPEQGARIQPVYAATESLPATRLAGFVASALQELPPWQDFLPEQLRDKYQLWELDRALRGIHQPESLAAVYPARDRLVYDELLCLQIGLQRRRHLLESESVGITQAPSEQGLAAQFLANLPFAPTGAQERAFAQIGDDLARGKPMHRLLQGDVGSGKTLVAAWTMLCALDHGRQAVLMAPTEILAEQHVRTLSNLLAPLGVNVLDGPRLELVTGSTPAKRLRGVLAEIASGDVQLVVGTHALLEDRVLFADLGVVIVDEQHRFGVEHRARLRDKRADDKTPDVLVMTATPIPRSLALTLYGDLDVTVLDEMPPGRKPVITQVIEAGSQRRAKLYDFIRERVAAGERAYFVCPLVEDSDVLDVASAEATFGRLSTEVFPELRVGLVHGRVSTSERDQVMEAFRRGEIQVLVATTVIEVGVDVPEATVMVIEDAERFGLSQLHQLRGRVGRGADKSYCVLFSGKTDDGGLGNPRLEALATTSDGFELAEKDLALRGEGSLFDTRQSGLPDLKLAQLIRDFDWVVKTRNDAQALIAADPDLAAYPALHDEVRQRYGDERLAALEVG